MRRRLVLLTCLLAALLDCGAALRGSPISATPAAATFEQADEVNRISLAEGYTDPPPYANLTSAALTPDLLPYTESSMCASALFTLLQSSR